MFFPTIPPQSAVPLAIAQGRLVLSESGCLLIKNPADPPDFPGLVPVWPSDYEPEASDGGVRIRNARGLVVAQVGKRIFMGGGEIASGALRGNDLMDERELRELSERCPDDYWMVGEDTPIPGRRS